MRLRLLVLILLALIGPVVLAADKKAETKKKESAEMFGLDKVWSMHLTISSTDWAKMPPTRGLMFGPGGFGPPGGKGPEKEKAKDEKNPDRKPRGGFGFDFEYVKGDLEIQGQKLTNVGVRFKGNASYMASRGKLKRPFKIDLNRYHEGQIFQGQKKLTLNNNVMDASAAREVLSYATYRALDVPAPRTAYVQLTITVPGKYDKEFVGLYTLIESIDKTFLKDRFGSSKGLLLKPERVGPLDYLGEDWGPYEQRYQPKTEGSAKDRRRFIAFTKLVQRASDEEFKKEIHNYLDVDECLRFLAATVMLSSMDSFLSLGHNYYIYLDPKTNKFVFLPWDFDHSMGGFVMMGSVDTLADLSIRQPQTGRNRLIERLFADEKLYAAYKGHLNKLLEKGFTVEGAKRDLAAINAAIDPIKEKEKKAVTARREGGGTGFGGGMFGMGPPPDVFVAKRVASVKGQLAGERKGTVLAFGFGPPGGFNPWARLVKPILDAADTDKNGKLSKEELIAGAKLLFKALDKDHKGSLDEKLVLAGLDRVLPVPGGGPAFGAPGGFPGMGGGPNAPLAKALLDKAGQKGKLTEESLVAAVGKLFTEADKNKDGQLDGRELTEALGKLIPTPRFGPPGGFNPGAALVKPILDAADTDKDGKLSREEAVAGAKLLFKTLDKEKKGSLDEKLLLAGLEKLFPAPGRGGPGGVPGGFPGGGFPGMGGVPNALLAKVLIDKAGQKGKLTEESLVAAVGKLFTEADKNKDGQLDGRELTEALGKLIPTPRFGPPGGGGPVGPPGGAPRPSEKDKKEEGR